MKIYKKSHSSATALAAHVKKIEAGGGRCKVKGNTIEYSYPSRNSTSITATNTVQLVKEAVQKGYKNVTVVYLPAYNAKQHASITNKKVIETLKKPKVETFKVIDDATTILELKKSKGLIRSIKFT